MYKQKLWMIPAAYYVGLASIVVGFFLVFSGLVSPWWLLAWFVGHNLGALLLSVGLHRYFSHGSFTTSKFWHAVMAFGSVTLFQGSPHGWATAHITHHVYSDTDRDPHYANWHYLFDKKYRDVPMVKRRLRHLVSDPILKIAHRYSLLIAGGLFLALALISWKLVLFGYLMSLGTSHFVGAVHQITSHRNKTPRDLPFMEFILPACGEWYHGVHHQKPKLYRLGRFDLGARVIEWIKT